MFLHITNFEKLEHMIRNMFARLIVERSDEYAETEVAETLSN